MSQPDRSVPDTTSPGMIRLEGVGKTYPDGTIAVHELDLDVPHGAIVCLVGPSGCGKSTTLKMVNRLIEPTTGRIYLDGVDVTSTSSSPLVITAADEAVVVLAADSTNHLADGADSTADDDEDDAPGTTWGEYPTAGYVCLDPDAHGHQPRYGSSNSSGYGSEKPKRSEMTPEQAEAARAERRDVIASLSGVPLRLSLTSWKVADLGLATR